MSSRYSLVQNVGLMVSVLPVVAAWLLVDTLDWAPYFVCGGLGLALAFALRPLRAALRRRTAGFMAGEVAVDHAPGGFVLWVGPPLWCIALGLFANAYLDGSPPESHASEVVRRHRPNKGPEKLILRGIRPGEAELAISANSAGVGSLTAGQDVTIVTRAGLFGWTRVASVAPR